MNLVSQVFIRCIQKVFFSFSFVTSRFWIKYRSRESSRSKWKKVQFPFFLFFFFQKYKTCFVAKGLMYWCEIWSRLGANTLISIAHQEKAETLRKSYLAPEGLWTLSYYCGLRESLCIEVSERLKSYNQQKVNLSSYLVFLYFSQYPSISFVEMVRCRALIRADEKEDLVLDYSSFKSYLEVLLCN